MFLSISFAANAGNSLCGSGLKFVFTAGSQYGSAAGTFHCYNSSGYEVGQGGTYMMFENWKTIKIQWQGGEIQTFKLHDGAYYLDGGGDAYRECYGQCYRHLFLSKFPDKNLFLFR